MPETNPSDTHPQGLCHYTSLANLVSILETGALILSDPARWEDRNDAASVEAYRRKTGAAQVRVLSLASGDEQIHLWFAYARKEYGAYLRFNTSALLAALERIPGLVCGPLRYTPREDISAAELRAAGPEALPFIKRRPYEAEQEYRVLWTGGPDESPPEIPIAGLLDRVTLAPGMAAPFGPALAEMLAARYTLKVQRSRLLNSPDWISLFNNLGNAD
ncbi:MAG: hypothetical protein LBD08_02445 [Treponema sp.]|jgi:hypothetical protein|nr:hypothetical protein [Treponema sp.]